MRPDLSRAARAIYSISNISNTLLADLGNFRWRQALGSVLTSRHDTVLDLINVLGVDAFGRLQKDLTHLLAWAEGIRSDPPNSLSAKLDAIDRKVKHERNDEKDHSLQAWVDRLLANQSAAHKWTNQPNTSVQLGQASDGCLVMDSHIRDQENKFAKLWKVGDINFQHAFGEAFLALRARALDHSGRPGELEDLRTRFSPANIKRHASLFKKNTSVGLCNWSVHLFHKLPDYILEALGDIFNFMVECVVGPASGMTALLHVVPKRLGGFRTVCTFSSCWRLFMSITAVHFRQWDIKASFSWDTAVKTRSPSLHVLSRAIWEAVAVLEGKETVNILWDIASFYETCHADDLVLAADNLDMPPTATAVAMWGHFAPRWLKLRGQYAESSLTPGCSLATGCHSNTSLARGIMSRPLNAVNDDARLKGTPGAPVMQSVHIDDVPQECHGFADEVFLSMAEAGGKFISIVQSMGLEVSPKSVILSSSVQLQDNLVRFFRHHMGWSCSQLVHLPTSGLHAPVGRPTLSSHLPF